MGLGETFFLFFAAVRAEFWNKTVMYLRAVRELALRQRPEGQQVRSFDLRHHKRGFICFFQFKGVKRYIATEKKEAGGEAYKNALRLS